MPSTLTTPDGQRLHLHEWPLAQARGTVLIVHGLGEHAGRYDHVAARLRDQRWRVVAYDHRGHGLSGGGRGRLAHRDDLLTDLATTVDLFRAEASGPFVLLGHSMGGLVTAQFVARALRPAAIDGLILTSPALDAGLSALQRLQLAVGHALVPDLAMSNQLDPSCISHDAAVVAAYRADPLVHDRVTARLARALVDGGREVLALAGAWSVPTLLLWAGADRIVSPAGSATFAASAPKRVVESHRFDALYHEILNETADAAAPVFAAIERWLAAHFPPGPPPTA